jgi:hypothetical protein
MVIERKPACLGADGLFIYDQSPTCLFSDAAPPNVHVAASRTFAVRTTEPPLAGVAKGPP